MVVTSEGNAEQNVGLSDEQILGVIERARE
jgi:hypothetical protein